MAFGTPTYNSVFPHMDRTAIASLVFAFCCLVSSARLLIDAPSPGTWRVLAAEVPRRSDMRFAALKAALPQRGVVGYVGEPGPAANGDYYLTQYALVPLIVDRSIQHSLVIGNFPNIAPSAVPDDLRLVKDFGNGVLLFAAKGSQ